MADTTIPSSGIDGYTPEQFEKSGQTATVVGDTLVIAAATKKNSITPITNQATYNIAELPESGLTLAGNLRATYKGGLIIDGSNADDTLTFGARKSDISKTKVRDAFVDLAGGTADTLIVKGNTAFTKTTVVIDNKDQIITKKGTFTSDDINKNDKIKGAGWGGIKFDVV
jgi:hypothetical protein